MADDVRVTNWPMGGSNPAVALELFKLTRHLAPGNEGFDGQLEAYRKCLSATYGQK